MPPIALTPKTLPTVRAILYGVALSLLFFVFIKMYEDTHIVACPTGSDLIFGKGIPIDALSSLPAFTLLYAVFCFTAFILCFSAVRHNDMYFFLLSVLGILCLLLLYTNIPILPGSVTETGIGYKLSIGILAIAGCIGLLRGKNDYHPPQAGHTTLNINIITSTTTENKP